MKLLRQLIWLTVTWDVFKSNSTKTADKWGIRLTVTWDVFKSLKRLKDWQKVHD